MAVDNSRLYRAATSGEASMRLFAELSLALANSLNYSETLQVIARRIVVTLCDYAIIYRADTGITRAAVAHRDNAEEGILQELLKQPVSAAMERDIRQV